MSVYSNDTIESIDNVDNILSRFIQDPKRQFHFMKLFSGAVSVDEKGRTGLVVYVVAQRRKAVMKLYNSYKGNHYNLIAKILGISVATIENDVRHYYASRNLKKHDKKKAAFTAMTSENLNP